MEWMYKIMWIVILNWVVFQFWVKVRFDVYKEFPIIFVNISDEEVELIVDSPQKWYRIQTIMKNRSSCIMNDRRIVIGMLIFVNGIV